MPLYCYKCPVCDGEEERLLLISQRDDLQLCSSCGSVLKRVYISGKKKFAESKGFWSSTMGCGVDQVADERRRHPDWKISDGGRVWVENFKDQRKKCRELGMINKDDNV